MVVVLLSGQADVGRSAFPAENKQEVRTMARREGLLFKIVIILNEVWCVRGKRPLASSSPPPPDKQQQQ